MKDKQRDHLTPDFDAIVIGAGFSGLYMLHRLRKAGYRTQVYEAGADVGGVWYWNRYPGARCDSESMYYNYTFSKELYKEWTWTDRFPQQEEILHYLNYVADKFNLRKGIQFNTRVTAAHYNEEQQLWHIYTDDDSHVTTTFFISGAGCLSTKNVPNFKGLEHFKGAWYHTGNWPHENVDFTGKRVGVIGTGSSGIQAIPVIAKEADHLTVFQRTPQYTVPAKNHPLDPEIIKEAKANYHQIKRELPESINGVLTKVSRHSALEDDPEERQRVYEEAWQEGGFSFPLVYKDLTSNEASNETAASFIRQKIEQIVEDPETAKKLQPDHYYGTKRPNLDDHYYQTFNRDNVTLADVNEDPIAEITSKGIRTTSSDFPLDVIVFATGFDGMTGSLFKIDIRGRKGVALKEKWEDGGQVRTYLGLATADFPNFFMITGPESPSVLVNMPTAIEQHVEWIAGCLEYMQKHGKTTVEANPSAEKMWSKHSREIADKTLFPKTDSWYTGANIPGKPRSFLIYLGGFEAYTQICHDVAAKYYDGFTMS
ncbi:hypothetical protein M948_05455 [Virgibacillus sp. CM-4]|uniref:flavin-containing monooxygenase n=1 Tax=Virgibacillus sp. CM-4 TaxID=1354277 RepID=UPI0003882B3B|nr:NAD(P)/FAD-dependent oxidoreductase [Virgibacillus sp. CM-4]EQB38017.1 hypothetical protein M948_05455 [Virgibacillus sp. CM-4]